MNNFFSLDGLFYKVSSRVWNILILNILIVLTSLPIITIGAAQTAGFTVITRMINYDESHIVSTFFDSFKKNFKQSTIVWLALSVLVNLLMINWNYLISFKQLNSWKTIGMVIVSLAVVSFCQYIFFYLSRFDDSIKQAVFNVIKLPIYYPVRSLILLLIILVPVLLMFLSPYLFVFGMYIGIFIGISFNMFLRAYLLLYLFKKV
jgi:uncharacterized membrane protein YesL